MDFCPPTNGKRLRNFGAFFYAKISEEPVLTKNCAGIASDWGGNSSSGGNDRMGNGASRSFAVSVFAGVVVGKTGVGRRRNYVVFVKMP